MRPKVNMTLAKKTILIINQVSSMQEGNKGRAVDYICSKYHENREILEDPEATRVAKAWISERNRRLSQTFPTPYV